MERRGNKGKDTAVRRDLALERGQTLDLAAPHRTGDKNAGGEKGEIEVFRDLAPLVEVQLVAIHCHPISPRDHHLREGLHLREDVPLLLVEDHHLLAKGPSPLAEGLHLPGEGPHLREGDPHLRIAAEEDHPLPPEATRWLTPAWMVQTRVTR